MKRTNETVKSASLDPYQMLANAVIIQAVRDYRAALKRVMKGEIHKRWIRIDEETEVEMDKQFEEALDEKNDIEEFFLSGRHHMFTDVDGSYLVKRIKAEMKFVERKREPKKTRKIMKKMENNSQSAGI